MGTILASAIVDEAESILGDSGNNRYDAADHLIALNDGQREAAIIKPDVSVTQVSTALVAGTKQSLTAGGIQLIAIIRNMGVSPGATPGNAIKLVDMDFMNSSIPNWHVVASHAASATVINYMFDLRNPTVFYVYPAQPASGFGYVDMIYSVTPAEVSALTGAITLDDIYKGALVDYIVYKALSREADVVKHGQRANAHYSYFARALGVKDAKEEQDDPNR